MRQSNLSQNSLIVLGIIAILGVFGFAITREALGFQLLATDVTTGTVSSASGLELYTGNGINELTMLRGCSDEDVLKFDDGSGVWSCQADATVAVTGAGAVTLDLGDDSSNESTALSEIATTGDTNSIFTEPSADKLLIAVGSNWPTADAADALSANPADCAANQFANTIAANGDLTCAAIADADVPNTITIDLAAAATALAADPSDCAADTKADAIAASGNLTCSAVDTGDITDGTVLPADLNDGADTPADEECLTYEGTGTIFEWQSCGGSQNLFETVNTTSGTSPVADSPTDTLSIAAGTGITVTGDSGTDTVTIASTVTDTDTHANSFETHSTPLGSSPVADSDTDTLTWSTTLGTVAITGDASADGIALDVQTDGIGTDQLNDGTDTPAAGECVQVSGDTTAFIYGACGGAGANLFETMDAPIGTDPVADDPNDTLAFTSTQGTISITGSAAADSLDFDLNPSGVNGTGWGSDAGPFDWTFFIGGALDPIIKFADGLISYVTDLLLDNEAELRWGEADGNGSNYIAVKAPAAVTSDQTCTLEDDSTPFDSCVTPNDGAGYEIIQNAGAPLTQRATVNMTGSAVSCSDTGAITECTFTDVDTDTHANSFETWVPISGDNIVADLDSDTATLISSNGTVAITGTGASDQLDFDAIGVNCTACLGTAQITGLDVSSDLNLTAGRSLTLTDDDVAADPELYTDTHTIWFENPTAADDFQTIWTAVNNSYTITAITCESDQTVNFDLQIDDGSPTGVNGSDIACTTYATDSSLAGDTGLDAGERLDLAITSVSGTPTWVSISWTVTKND